jgi:RHS repeat-associated protein
LQSVTALTDHTGEQVETTEYGPFGEMTGVSGSSPNSLKYTGRLYDEITGHYYYRARHYDPETGRFISEDPLGFEAGINFYAYVLNNPINFNDPDGLILNYVIGGGSSVLMGYGLSMLTGQDYSWKNAAIDFTLGAVGVGVINKGSKLWQLHKVKNMAVPGRELGVIGENLAGIAPKGKTAISSLTGNAVRRFPDKLDDLGNITEVKNVLEISAKDATQIFDSILYSQKMGGTTTLLTRGSATNISRVQGFVDDGLLQLGKIPRISPSGVANLSNSASAGIGLGVGAGNNASGGFVLYPNKPNTNMLQSVYAK